MNKNSLPFVSTFNKYREQPKWLINMLLVIIIGLASAWVTILSTDVTSMFKDMDLSDSDLKTMSSVTTLFTYIGTVIGFIINIVILFLVLLVISKIMRSDVKAASIFSAATFMVLITVIFSFIVNIIQALAGLDPFEYSITSLKIFNQDNSYLGAFDLQTLLASYLFGILLYATSNLKGRTAFIWGIIYFIIVLGFGLVSSSTMM